MALFGGKIKVSEVTEHCRTNMEVVEMFLPVKFNVERNMEGEIISVERI